MTARAPDLTGRDTYEAFAATYDDFNHTYQYEAWTGRLLALAHEYGLNGTRLLDVGCGTGLSFLPILDRGWQVTACDISQGMLDRAAAKTGDRAELHLADMRNLPVLGSFDLVWAVNDAVNYLMGSEELVDALISMARNMAPEGRLLFDLNTLHAYRAFFHGTHERSFEEQRFLWRGLTAPGAAAPGAIFEAEFRAEGRGTDHVHRQRHFPEAEVLAAIDAAGLRCQAVAGEREGILERGLDESTHTKAVYLCAERR